MTLLDFVLKAQCDVSGEQLIWGTVAELLVNPIKDDQIMSLNQVAWSVRL